MIKKYLIIIGFSLIPSFLVFSGKNDLLFNWCAKHTFIVDTTGLEKDEIVKKKDNFQLWAFGIGIVFTGLLIPIRLAHIESKFKIKKKSFSSLVSYNRELQFKLLRREIDKHNYNFNTYIFMPSGNIFIRLFHKSTGNITLSLKHIDGVCDDFHSKHLSFSIKKKAVKVIDVSKEPEANESIEGMVGTTYVYRRGFLSSVPQTDPRFYLTDSQKSKINNLKFCATYPIFDEKSKKVIAVVSMDGNEPLELADKHKKDKFKENFMYYSSFIDKHFI